MRKPFSLILLAVVAALALAVGALATRTPAAEERIKRDLILMRCSSGSSGFKITSYSASASAPSKTADNCAETLSTLHRDGFGIADIGYVDADDGYMIVVLGR
jgi:hypothetical protein